MPDKPTCSTCRAYERDPQNLGQGQCHLNPPQVTLLPVQNNLGQSGMVPGAMWPPVKSDQYCLQHQPAESTNGQGASHARSTTPAD